MTYEEIDKIMLAKGLATDPSFEDLRIAIEPIPCTDSCPLGLYFPVGEWSSNLQGVVPGKTIVIPPEATEGTLLHELGHRHGHYYYNDLSERYAENFRKRYQKGKALLYLGSDFSRLPEMGKLFEEGERGAVEIALAGRLTPDELYEIKNQLYPYGEAIPKLYYGNSEIPWVRVEFTTGVNWMVIIGAAMVASVLATVGAIGYAVYKISEELPWIVPVSLLGTGMFFLLRAMAREAKTRVTA